MMINNLKLTRNLATFDIESTGLDKTYDRIVTLFILVITPNGEVKKRFYKLNPTISIKPEATEVHGITDEDVKDCPTFREKAAEIRDIFKNCDLAGYNLKNFDIPLLVEEMLRVFPDFTFGDAKVIDAEVIFKKYEKRTLSAALEFYCGEELTDAHDAEADVIATAKVINSQISTYNDLGNTVEKLAEASNYDNAKTMIDYDNKLYKDVNGVVRFNFGKWQDEPVSDHFDYVNWMLTKDFTRHTMKCLHEIMENQSYNQDYDEGFFDGAKAEPDDNLPF